MNEKNKFIGCFISFGKNSDIPVFKPYIWGAQGIDEILGKLKSEKYGRDLTLILLQFYVNPMPYLLQNIKEIENYRSKEKSIGIPIIVNQDNFFNKSDTERKTFFKHSILQKIGRLAEVVEKKKLDTDIVLLRLDLEKTFNISV